MSWLEALRQLDIDAVDERLVRQAAGPETRRARAVLGPVPHRGVVIGGLERSEHGRPLFREPAEPRFAVGDGRQLPAVGSSVRRPETTRATRL